MVKFGVTDTCNLMNDLTDKGFTVNKECTIGGIEKYEVLLGGVYAGTIWKHPDGTSEMSEQMTDLGFPERRMLLNTINPYFVPSKKTNA